MSQPDDLRPEFEAFRAGTRAEFRAVRAEISDVRELATSADRQVSRTTANTRTLDALRETQLEHGRRLDEHGRLLRTLSATVADLVVGQVGLRGDVTDLQADVTQLRTDVTQILRLLGGGQGEER